MMSQSISLRELAYSLGVHGSTSGFVDMIESMTALAIQLDYPASPGTGGAYAGLVVTSEHAEIIVDMITHTDPETGVYTGDRDELAALAAQGEGSQH